MLRKWITSLATPLGAGASLLMMTAVTIGVYILYAHASVGPLSAAHTGETSLGGYNSHADFQQECTHCHGPIHCIVDNRCQNCHVDVAEQRAEALGLHGLLPVTSECQSCHQEHQGRETQITVFAFNNVDHTLLADFSLERHRTDYDGQPLNCESCHQLGQYGPEAMDCATCHVDHAPDFMAQHQNQYGDDCVGCHDGHDRLANFDHNEQFALTGEHTAVACEACHTNQVYAGTPTTCAGCHTEPDLHAGQFGLACERCHSEAGWTPAQLTQHTFPLDHGDDGRLECQACHADAYTQYPCQTCHEDADMAVAHPDLTTEELSDCLSCHPTGLIEGSGIRAN
ncbi:MAG: hypothetical protein H6659_10525 [Ardenticatenaceae bacterium]|nr:hypothetical protein [Ardenticatenaceae bacterium]MCB8987506.1 hypothetical protein [Ardenticatenaceae bacterium]